MGGGLAGEGGVSQGDWAVQVALQALIATRVAVTLDAKAWWQSRYWRYADVVGLGAI